MNSGYSKSEVPLNVLTEIYGQLSGLLEPLAAKHGMAAIGAATIMAAYVAINDGETHVGSPEDLQELISDIGSMLGSWKPKAKGVES